MNPVFAKVYPPPRFSVVLPIMDDPRFKIISPGELDDYRDQAGDIGDASWPEFMMQDSVANENWHELFDRFSEYQFALLDIGQNRMAAMGNSLPFYWDQPLEDLPEGGWDWVFLKAVADHKSGIKPTSAQSKSRISSNSMQPHSVM